MKIFTTVTIIIVLLICSSVNAQNFIDQYNKVKLYSIENQNATQKSSVMTLDQNYPNPFNTSTTIEFTIPNGSQVSLKIHNILGKEVISLVDKELKAGHYKVIWVTEGLPEGTYFYRLQSGESVKSRMLHKHN